jgi:hypothetical protein
MITVTFKNGWSTTTAGTPEVWVKDSECYQITPEIENLIRNYDFYTEMIENSGQRQNARDRNRNLENRLRELGVTRISNGHFGYNI